MTLDVSAVNTDNTFLDFDMQFFTIDRLQFFAIFQIFQMNFSGYYMNIQHLDQMRLVLRLQQVFYYFFVELVERLIRWGENCVRTGFAQRFTQS